MDSMRTHQLTRCSFGRCGFARRQQAPLGAAAALFGIALLLVAVQGHATSTAPGSAKPATGARKSPVTAGLPNVEPAALPQIDHRKLPWDPDGKRVVARVNGSRITEGMLRAELQRANEPGEPELAVSPQLKTGMVGPVLENLILSRLILGFARQHNLSVSDQDIDAWIRKENARLPAGRKLEDRAVEAGETMDELRDEVRAHLLHDRVEQRVGAHVQPTIPEQLARFRESHPAVVTTTTIRASHIVIGCRSDATTETVESARQLVMSIQAEIQSGLDFTSAAVRYSHDAVTRAQGGDLGFFRRGRMYPEFDNVAFNLEPGQISPIVRTPVGFHLIKVMAREPDNAQEMYMLTERKRAFTDWHTRALKSAKIERYL